MGILSNLEPAPVFHYFEEICGIPHGSTNTKAISDYCVTFAKEHHLNYIQDDSNNVIIFKDGTPGYENSAPVMLQGHLDMVCEKEADCDIDFTKDGLSLELQDNVISAKGTTLGGDDGIAVAYALAILASTDIPHPPLEVVLTVDEEIGMLGASALDCSPLKSRIMLNLDSEDEGYLLVSCAGGISTLAHLPVKKEEKAGTKITLTITGLLGGHSGVEIDKGRANACQLLGRTLYALSQKVSFHLLSVNGGLKDNAIPREAQAELLVTDTADIAVVRQTIEELSNIYQKEYHAVDSGIKLLLEAENGSSSEMVMTADTTAKIITALVNLPGGIQRMSHDIEGLVQTSLNLGILSTKETEVTFSFAVRSSVETEKSELVSRITCLMEALGGSVTNSGAYPAWEYRQDSMLRDLMISIFEKQYGRKPVVQALHAGVECGLFSGKLPGLDCVSFGPDMNDIHTPNESMDVASVQRTWNYTLEVLKELK
ncbi:MAG: aminoacyl-histidine dipeptidase [Butyribacter sp.]|nr:aminoacyl-histidine dipeptidase [bacterium]MDY3853642.1 aminoacyl-histidine dipeptidase [Butyribacter sp.]